MPINAALTVCGANNQQARNAFTQQGITNVADFAQLSDKDVKEMCVAMAAIPPEQNGYRLGALQIKRIRALAHWARKQQLRQLPIPNGGFTAALMAASIQELDMEAEEETEVKKPAKLNPEDWDVWEPSFVNYLKSLKGVQGTPLSYVIRSANLTVNDFDPQMISTDGSMLFLWTALPTPETTTELPGNYSHSSQALELKALSLKVVMTEEE